MGHNAPYPLYMIRVFQAIRGDIKFCGCKAGITYRRHLHNCKDGIDSGADRVTDKVRERIADYLEGRDIDYATVPVADAPAPTVHWDSNMQQQQLQVAEYA